MTTRPLSMQSILDEISELQIKTTDTGFAFGRGADIPNMDNEALLSELVFLRWLEGATRILGAAEGSPRYPHRGNLLLAARHEAILVELVRRGVKVESWPPPIAKGRKSDGNQAEYHGVKRAPL